MCSCGGGVVSNTSKSTTRKRNNKKVKNKELVCSVTPKVLQELDRNVIRMKRKEKKNKELKETSKILRGWITDIGHKCPDDTELFIITEFVKDEYSRIFSDN